MRINVLGPLSVVVDGRETDIGSATQRRALLFFVTRVNEVVPTDQIADALWHGHEPSDVRHAVHSLVYRLRQRLDVGSASKCQSLVRHDPGYLLVSEPRRIDARCFTDGITRGHELTSRRPHAARSAFGEALDLWRGEPFLDAAYEPWAAAEIRRLNELRVGACEALARANIELGRGDLAIAELQSLTGLHPLRESLWLLLWEALAQAGRHVEVGQSYRRAVETLAEEYAVAPSGHLREAGQRLADATHSPVPSTHRAQARR